MPNLRRAAVRCQVCKAEKSHLELVPAEFVRPALLRLIEKEHPDWKAARTGIPIGGTSTLGTSSAVVSLFDFGECELVCTGQINAPCASQVAWKIHFRLGGRRILR